VINTASKPNFPTNAVITSWFLQGNINTSTTEFESVGIAAQGTNGDVAALPLYMARLAYNSGTGTRRDHWNYGLYTETVRPPRLNYPLHNAPGAVQHTRQNSTFPLTAGFVSFRTENTEDLKPPSQPLPVDRPPTPVTAPPAPQASRYLWRFPWSREVVKCPANMPPLGFTVARGQQTLCPSAGFVRDVGSFRPTI
jgi:hypothetical protein